MDYGAYIRENCRMSEDNYRLLRYQVAMEFLYDIEHEERLIQALERSELFWNWYNRQFERLAREFVKKYGDSIEYERYEKIKTSFANYVHWLKVSPHGVESYLFVVKEIIKTHDKRRKQQAEV